MKICVRIPAKGHVLGDVIGHAQADVGHAQADVLKHATVNVAMAVAIAVYVAVELVALMIVRMAVVKHVNQKPVMSSDKSFDKA